MDAPIYPGCVYGKAHRKPTQINGVKSKKQLRTETAPVQVISVDPLVSPTTGFMPIHWGRPTTQSYVGATVFFDHFSEFTYIHLMDKLD